jgi:hypothetical protein
LKDDKKKLLGRTKKFFNINKLPELRANKVLIDYYDSIFGPFSTTAAQMLSSSSIEDLIKIGSEQFVGALIGGNKDESIEKIYICKN